MYSYIFMSLFFLFSDKLYKEIRDLNFEVVVQVHSTDLPLFILCDGTLC